MERSHDQKRLFAFAIIQIALSGMAILGGALALATGAAASVVAAADEAGVSSAVMAAATNGGAIVIIGIVGMVVGILALQVAAYGHGGRLVGGLACADAVLVAAVITMNALNGGIGDALANLFNLIVALMVLVAAGRVASESKS